MGQTQIHRHQYENRSDHNTTLGFPRYTFFFGKTRKPFAQKKNTRKKRDFRFLLTSSHTGNQDEFFEDIRDPSSFVGTQVPADSTSLSPIYPTPEKTVLLPKPWQMLSSCKDFF